MKTYNGWEIWRRYALVQHIIEIHILEERLSFELFGILLPRAKASGGVSCKELITVSLIEIK